jgi:hypothetical protein
MSVALANARQTVAAPVRKARRFDLLSVADVIDGGASQWMLGGLTADGEECSEPETGDIVCGPMANKTSRSWYSDIDADPWLAYMYETCKTVGRVSESAAKLRARFLASESAAVEMGFQDHILNQGTAVGTGAFQTVRQAVAALEHEAVMTYGGQVILHLPYVAAAELDAAALVRVDGHLETVGGNLVVIGNYHPDHEGGTLTVPVVYATGAISLYRSTLVESGPVVDQATNDYFTLIERAYGGLVDCLNIHATGTLCGC